MRIILTVYTVYSIPYTVLLCRTRFYKNTAKSLIVEKKSLIINDLRGPWSKSLILKTFSWMLVLNARLNFSWGFDSLDLKCIGEEMPND